MSTDLLVAFLAARLDETAAAAEAAQADWDAEHVRYEFEDLPDDVYTHARLHDPARVLREVEAKRAILDLEIAPAIADYGEPDLAKDVRYDIAVMVLRHLAAVYRDHPDYRQEWKP